jgi:hypothetical protein
MDPTVNLLEASELITAAVEYRRIFSRVLQQTREPGDFFPIFIFVILIGA